MQKPLQIYFNKNEYKIIEKLKEFFNEKTASKVIKKLLNNADKMTIDFLIKR